MQYTQKNARNLPTFAEICLTMDRYSRKELVGKIITELGVCEKTVRNWYTGVYIPANLSQMKGLCKVVKKTTGLDVKPVDLFPTL